jgi:hypothetical protein
MKLLFDRLDMLDVGIGVDAYVDAPKLGGLFRAELRSLVYCFNDVFVVLAEAKTEGHKRPIHFAKAVVAV